jgi:hypothetical protein
LKDIAQAIKKKEKLTLVAEDEDVTYNDTIGTASSIDYKLLMFTGVIP